MARPFDLLDRNFEPHRPRIELLVLPAVEQGYKLAGVVEALLGLSGCNTRRSIRPTGCRT